MNYWRKAMNEYFINFYLHIWWFAIENCIWQHFRSTKYWIIWGTSWWFHQHVNSIIQDYGQNNHTLTNLFLLFTTQSTMFFQNKIDTTARLVFNWFLRLHNIFGIILFSKCYLKWVLATSCTLILDIQIHDGPNLRSIAISVAQITDCLLPNNYVKDLNSVIHVFEKHLLLKKLCASFSY